MQVKNRKKLSTLGVLFLHKFTFFSLISSFQVDLFAPWGRDGKRSRLSQPPAYASVYYGLSRGTAESTLGKTQEGDLTPFSIEREG